MSARNIFSQRLLAVADSRIPFPEWVRESVLPDPQHLEKAAATAFADEARSLPIQDKVSTFLSAIQVVSEPEKYAEKIASRVQKAVAHFGIEGDIAPYADLAIDELEKVASSSPVEITYAIELQDDGVQVLPLNDKSATEYAAAEVWKMAGQGDLPHMLVVEALPKIVAAAEQFGAEIPDRLVKMAKASENHWLDWDKAEKLTEGRHFRATRGDAEEAKQHYAGVLKEARAEEISPDEAVMKLAAVDLLYGVQPSYPLKYASTRLPTHVPTPTEIVYCGDDDLQETCKAATENVLVRETLIPFVEFKNLPKEEIRLRLSKEAAQKWDEMPENFDAIDATEFMDKLANEDVQVFVEVLLR